MFFVDEIILNTTYITFQIQNIIRKNVVLIMLEWTICENCGKLLDNSQDTCPFCGSDVKKVDISYLKDYTSHLLVMVRAVDGMPMDFFPQTSEWKNNGNTIESAIIDDLLNWLGYLGLCDGNITDNELDFINQLFDLNYSKDEIDSLGKSDLPDLPISFKLLREYDQFQEYLDYNSVNFCDTLLKVFKLIGGFFIVVDDDVEGEIQNRYEKYVIGLTRALNDYNPDFGDVEIVPKTTKMPTKKDEKTIDDYLDELNRLIGLEDVKKDVNSLINLVQIRKIRQERGIKQPPMSLHLVFSGNPGTGKTTVARLLSKIYYEIGVLSKGHLVECDRSALVGGYVGQTAIKTQEVIQNALGGILFIDEAYSLASSSENDYGQEAINTILKAMEDHRDDLIVIVAGYPALMDRFLSSNPGLESRFNKFIYFDDYDDRQLYEIFMLMCDEASLKLDDMADTYLKEYFKKMYETRSKNFANGRSVRNFFEEVLTAQANRLAPKKEITDEELNTLTYEDFMIDEE